MGGQGSQSGSQSTAQPRQSKSSWNPRWSGSDPLRRHWLTIAAGVLGSGALVVALVIGGGTGAGAQPGSDGGAAGQPDGPPASASPPAQKSPQPAGLAPTAAPREVAKKKPAKVKIPASGPGAFVRAKVDGPKVGRKGAQFLRYDVKVEKNLPYDADETARQIQTTLSDSRSWIGVENWLLQLVSDPAKADFTIYLATPGTVDRYCWPLRTYGKVSCQAGSKVMLNARRWAYGAPAYGKDVSGYRQYLVNHEVGHRLGHGHVGCPGKGKRAPVMMQQTKGVGGCRANPWPNPKRQS